jgi:hypothetical protein
MNTEEKRKEKNGECKDCRKTHRKQRTLQNKGSSEEKPGK